MPHQEHSCTHNPNCLFLVDKSTRWLRSAFFSLCKGDLRRAPVDFSPHRSGTEMGDPWFRLRPRSLQRCVPRSPEAGPGSGQRGPGPRAQKGRLGGRRPSGRASAASVSSPLAAPARGPAGLGSQSPATGPPGTRLVNPPRLQKQLEWISPFRTSSSISADDRLSFLISDAQ